MISTVVGARENATANERQVAVAVNAARTEKAAVATLLNALEQSSAYSASGQVSAGGVGTRFAASA